MKHDIRKTITEFFAALGKLLRMNLSGIWCPYCYRNNLPTAKFAMTFDKNARVWKYYLKCNCCGRVTPAYENFEMVVDNWDDLFVPAEHEILLGKE